mgnify:CR=1 FL=1
MKEEQLIAPHVENLAQNQYWISTSLGEWFQSYETTIAFKGEFGVLISKDWYEGGASRTTSKWLGHWLSHVTTDEDLAASPGAGGVVPWRSHIKSGKYKLTSLPNFYDLKREELWEVQSAK